MYLMMHGKKTAEPTTLWHAPLLPARFRDRPNRFTVICKLGGTAVRAYLPNPGRLQELLLPDADLLLERSRGQGKLAYTVVAILKDGHPILVHTLRSNDVAQHLLQSGSIPGLTGITRLQREVRHGSSRFDFLVHQGASATWLEVKSCTLFSRRLAMFPDAVSLRAARHVNELARMADAGTPAMVLFLVYSREPDYFLPEFHRDPAFSSSLLNARDRVTILALAPCFDKCLRLRAGVKRLRIPWQVVRDNAVDAGAYLLIMHLPEARDIAVGKLGNTRFPAGYYIYTGSARKHLSKRVARHKRRRKSMHWHIDYLLAACRLTACEAIRNTGDLECLLAHRLSACCQWTIPGFGASDCPCGSHLFGFYEPPHTQPWYHQLLRQMRMDRLLPAISSSLG